MKKLALNFLIIIFCSTVSASTPYFYLENGKKVVFEREPYVRKWPVVRSGGQLLFLNGEITAKTDKKSDLEALKKIISNKKGMIKNIHCRKNICYTSFMVADGSDPFKITDHIHRSGIVNWVQPDWKVKVKTRSIPNDPFIDYQWHLPMINASRGWRISYGEPYSIVAILDSGVSIDHEDIKGNIIRGKSFARNPETGVSPLLDAKGFHNNLVAAHGTAIAGIIGAVTDNWTGIAGVCGKCSVMPVKFFDYYEEYIQVSRVLNAFIWMVDNGASVINNSWGEIDVDGSGNCISIVEDNYRNEAVNYAAKHGRKGLGTVVVWAAGNSSCDTALNSNYNNPDILLTGAVDRYSVMAGYTNYGDRIDVALPDASFTTDIPGVKGMNDSVFPDFHDLDYTSSFTGTSASAAVASGIAGLIISVNPSLTSKEVLKCMKAAAKQPEQICYMDESDRKSLNISSDPENDHNKCFGFGVIDVEKALEMAENGKCGNPYKGCSENDECPAYFKCSKENNTCVEDISNPLPRYGKEASGGCSLLFIN